MKIIALYLPQFHRVKENDEWWGEGYTDWVAVKNAKKLYSEHNQPKVPLNNNYYDLSSANTLRWQSEIMRKYGVDGLCFYHYCFKDNELLLEKPAETLLDNKDIEIPFCFCWANESWVHSWNNVNNSNVWSYQFEKKNKTENGYLMEQKYGNKEQWVAHFNYLLPFFKDQRYILKNNKPIFLIYRTELIACLEEMRNCWDVLARENGFDGIYIIAGNCELEDAKYIDAFYEHEPRRTKPCTPFVKTDEIPAIYDYDDIWRLILSNRGKKKQTIFGGFIGYDDTPRHGNKGTVIENRSPEKFGSYLSELIAKNEVYGNDFLFLNAWNEWGEGMYLEPDSEDGFKYLEEIKRAKHNYKKYLRKYNFRKKYDFLSISENQKDSSLKDLSYIGIIDNWLELYSNGHRVEDYFIEHSITNIYIYGMGKIGKHLLRDLKGREIEISGIFARSLKDEYLGIPVLKMGDTLPMNSVVVIALSYEIDYVKDILFRTYGDSVTILEVGRIILELLDNISK